MRVFPLQNIQQLVPDGILKNRYIPAFFKGILLSMLLYTYTEWQYESQLFNHLVASIQSSPATAQHEDSFLVQAMHVSHSLLANRQPVFSDKPFSGFKTGIVYPVSFDLMTGSGACGSYSRVLAGILQTGGVAVRFAQMTANDRPGSHIVIEAHTSHGWVVLDPLYDLYFTTPKGQLAGFAQVQHNWPYYAKQVPANYTPSYNYAGVQYTNWNKIPVLLPLAKKMLQQLIGAERTEHISLRTYFLQPYKLAFQCTLVTSLFILTLSLRRLFKRYRFPLPERQSNTIPFPAHHVIAGKRQTSKSPVVAEHS